MKSSLNPEAPEFHPNLTSVSQDGYRSIGKSVKTSNQFPAGSSLDICKTSTEYICVTSKLRENVVNQSNGIITTELPNTKLQINDNQCNAEKIIDVNDSILDRININIDSICHENEPSGENAGDENGGSLSEWNESPENAQASSSTSIDSQNIPRPQISFKDPVDNSESLWVPKISDKPNNILPLALNILYNKQGEPIGYRHPYKVELKLYHPPAKFIEPDTDIFPYPQPLEKTPLTYITTEEQVDSLVKHLSEVDELAVDVEHHSYRTFQGITCLIQISTIKGDFVIDALAVREHIHKFNLSFTDPRKVKILHGAKMDILWLQRDFGVYIVGLFDTYYAAQTLKLSNLSLKYLLKHYCEVEVDKRFQLADWRIRPLPEEMINYARSDTHYLLYIWRKMKSDLLKADGGQPQLLLSVFQQSKRVCGTTYNKQVVHENSHLDLYIRSKKSFNSRQMAALKLLYKWRDTHARELDESIIYLLPNHMMLSLAETLPREVQGVLAICTPLPSFVKQNVLELHKMLLSCRELPIEPQLYQMPQSISNMANLMNESQFSCDVHDLSCHPEYSDDQPVDLDRNVENIENCSEFGPNIQAFKAKSDRELNNTVIEEIKEFKEKEAKITAIGKGNEFIKTEVLVKMKEVKSVAEPRNKVDNQIKEAPNEAKNSGDGCSQKPAQYIKNRSAHKKNVKLPSTSKDDKNEPKPKNNDKLNKSKNKPETKNESYFNYKNVNYKKFNNENEQKTPKQTKNKNKKK
ncbi:exosome complex component 10 homolog isoform X2 [Battus philenor]|uniref:exosome complex component 10 homolog isoform X2 n=1 Tax=Battus philenor TaxID=42288 RepID=UPI0035CF0C62